MQYPWTTGHVTVLVSRWRRHVEMLVNRSHHLSCLEYSNRLNDLSFSFPSAQSILEHHRQSDPVKTWFRSGSSSAQNLLGGFPSYPEQKPKSTLYARSWWLACLSLSCLSPLVTLLPCTSHPPTLGAILLAPSSAWIFLGQLSPWAPSHSFLKTTFSSLTLSKMTALYLQDFYLPSSLGYTFPLSTYHSLKFLFILSLSH